MKIYLQRHTQPDIDPSICYGVSDMGLHSDFESNHLPEVLARLSDIGVSQIYSSPLKRCHRLAREIKEVMGLKNIIVDRRLKELDFGDWELTPWNDVYEMEEGKEWFDDFINRRVPNGESFNDLLARAESFLEDVRPLNADILVVTHAGFIRAVMVANGMVEAKDIFSVELAYGELVEINI